MLPSGPQKSSIPSVDGAAADSVSTDGSASVFDSGSPAVGSDTSEATPHFKAEPGLAGTWHKVGPQHLSKKP